MTQLDIYDILVKSKNSWFNSCDLSKILGISRSALNVNLKKLRKRSKVMGISVKVESTNPITYKYKYSKKANSI